MTKATKADIDRAIKQQDDRRRQAVAELNMSDEELAASYVGSAAVMGAFFEPGFFAVEAIRERAREDAFKPIDLEKAQYDADLYRDGVDNSNSDI
jgi:hypothetical protein